MNIKKPYQIIIWLCLVTFFALTASAQVPTITIQTTDTIVDEPKVSGTFVYTDINGAVISSDIGIEIRGGFSQTYPKKTYDIEFWDDPSGSESVKVQFGNLRIDDDWILDAMYNEPLRINSFMTHKLWLEMNELYYQEQEPEAKSGADVMYVEVTINGEYQGVFLLSEQVDRVQLKLKKNDDLEMRGELYKAYGWDDAVLFNNPDEVADNTSFTWSGYEFRYPTQFIDWSNAEELVNFIANSSDEDFISEIESRFDFTNLMDYFILLNIARLLDNRGKNIYLSRYDAGEPYFFTPWDLDGSWGLLWNGNNDTTTEGILSNNLYDRIIATDAAGFRVNISNRWQELRSTMLSDDALEIRINTAHQFLLDRGLYEKEETAWDYEYSSSDLDYLFNWLNKRLTFLDDYFDDITSVANIDREADFVVFPNPAKDYIYLYADSGAKNPIKIYNVLGEVKIETSDLLNNNRIDLGNLTSGMYIIESGNYKRVFYKH